MADKKNKPNYQITWPEGAELKMDPKHLMEIRNSLETQFKLMIYKQPGLSFFHLWVTLTSFNISEQMMV